MARVLVADDDPAFRSAMAAAVTALGHEVEFAADGEAAIEAQRNRPCEVVLLDVLMPRRGGISTLHALTTLFPALPVVVVTGNAALLDAPICRDGLRGARAVVGKHLSLDALRRLLDRTLPSPTAEPA
jgi:CheY-like chemotaxis protein